MTSRRRGRGQESFEGLQLRDEVRGTRCPVDECAAHTDPEAPCAVYGTPTRTPHIARITATRKPAIPPPQMLGPGTPCPNRPPLCVFRCAVRNAPCKFPSRPQEQQ